MQGDHIRAQAKDRPMHTHDIFPLRGLNAKANFSNRVFFCAYPRAQKKNPYSKNWPWSLSNSSISMQSNALFRRPDKAGLAGPVGRVGPIWRIGPIGRVGPIWRIGRIGRIGPIGRFGPIGRLGRIGPVSKSFNPVDPLSRNLENLGNWENWKIRKIWASTLRGAWGLRP